MAGAKINPALLRARLLKLLLAPEGLLRDMSDLARELGVNRSTVRRYWQEIRDQAEEKLREPIGEADLLEVERALLARARQGNVTAARLLFGRLNLIENHDVPADSQRLVEEIKRLVEQPHAPEDES